MTWQTTNTAKGDNKLYSDAKGVVPSLDLRFASQKNLNDYMTGTPLVDHQRSMSGSNLSPGTFVNSSGLIETAKVNLLPYSKDNLGWSTQDMNNDGAVEGPPGEGQATRFTSVGGTVASRVRYLSAFTTTAGVQYTLSIYVKPLNYNSVSFGLGNIGAGASRSDYNFSTGIVTNAAGTADASMEALGNGWWRLKNTIIAAPSSGSIPTLFLDLGDTAAETHATSEGFDVYGGQIEEGVDLNTYIQTIGVPSAAPRFDHDPTTGESLGLLIEDSRTNYITNSTNFAASVLPVTATLNFAVSPDNTVSATRHQSASSDTGTIILSKSATPGEIYTLSVYAKRNSGSGNLKLLIYELPSVAATVQTFTLTNEWQRFSITRTVGANQTSIQCRIVGTPANYDNLYWGAQVEEGSFPTSYIPTTGTALTRSADVASITGSNFSSWYNQGEGTVFVKGATNDIDGNTGWASFYQASSPNNNRISVRQGPTLITSAGTTIGLSASSSPTPKEIQKISTAYKNDDFALYSTYSTPVLLSAGSLPVSVDTALFGGVEGTGGAFNLNGTIARLTYFPDRLEDSVLQAITQ